MKTYFDKVFLAAVSIAVLAMQSPVSAAQPNVVFVMADDMGWGETGYRDHPVLKTPNLDAMAAAGLRFDRFYAGAPVCSPTRASVLTGRANNRSGVPSHGFALRKQEKTIAEALGNAGYVTGHFGKWHLNGLRGPGAPILETDEYHPGHFGFDEWVSVTNFYDLNPLMSRQGKIESFQGDSSEIAVAEAVKFLEKHHKSERPMFAVVWFGTPHSPFRALPKDKAGFSQLDANSMNHYGELVAMDRAVGTLRSSLRKLGIAENTLLVFCSDNGGLSGITPETVGGLRGHKGTVYEGGLRVPGITEWPGTIEPRVTKHPACTMDLFPTVAEIVELPENVFVRPLDGVSLRPLFDEERVKREKPIGFRYNNAAAWVDGDNKLVATDIEAGKFELYDLSTDPAEARNIANEEPEHFERMKKELLAWNDSVEASIAGRDYPEGKVDPVPPSPKFWSDTPAYERYRIEWKDRPEYKQRLAPRGPSRKSARKDRQ